MKHVLFIQNGDYREAYKRFAAGGAETYRDQRRSVEFVAGLTPQDRATVIAFGPETYDEELGPGLRAIGLPRADATKARISKMFETLGPSHVVLRTPHPGFLREVQKRRLWLLPVFADIFERHNIKTRLHFLYFRHLLMRSNAPCVSNHSLNASRSLVTELYLPERRVVPWDWSKVPMAGPAKTGVSNPEAPSAFFAGVLSEDKGVGDCLEAIAFVRKAGLDLTLSIAGPGDLNLWDLRARELGIADHIRLLGMVSNAQVRSEMHAADFVIVPSRHSYNEGLPNTIYEGLASRSVLVISDHPAFRGRLEANREALIFPASDPQALAECLMQATRNATLYHQISNASEQAHDGLYVGMEWTELVDTFLHDPANTSGWVEANTLASAS